MRRIAIDPIRRVDEFALLDTACYARAASERRWSAINRIFLDEICGWLGIWTSIVDARFSAIDKVLAS